MLSKNPTTQVELDVNRAFTRNASESLKEHERRQSLLDQKKHDRDMKAIGAVLIGVVFALLTGIAL